MKQTVDAVLAIVGLLAVVLSIAFSPKWFALAFVVAQVRILFLRKKVTE